MSHTKVVEKIKTHTHYLRINNQQDASSIQNFILSRNFMFRASTVPIISYQLYTWQLVCFMQVMWPLPRQHETYQLPRVQLITPDDEHSRCPKHVEFRDKIKFCRLDASCMVIYTKIITVHGHLNIKHAHYAQ
jgi:hypothetical protein